LSYEEIFKAKSKQGRRTDLCQNYDKSETLDTKKELAKIAGVSHDTLDKVKKIQTMATDEQKRTFKPFTTKRKAL